MKIILRSLLAGVAALALSHAADAAIAFKGSADLGNNWSAPSTVMSVPYTVNAASNMLLLYVSNSNGDATTFSATYNGNAMTPVSCTGGTANVANAAGLPKAFYIAPAAGTHDVVVTASAPVQMQLLAADYSGVGTLESCTPNYGTSPVTTQVSAHTAGDWIMIAAGGYTTQTAGSGDTLRVNDAAFNEVGLFDSNAAVTVGPQKVTTSLSIGNSINHLAMVFTAAPAGPTPTAINFSPATPALADNALSGATVSNFTVTTSDGSPYTGSNTVSPTGAGGEFNITATGNGSVTLSRNLASTDDGTETAAVTVTENGVAISKNLPLSVTPASVTGIPFALSWKNIDPGATTVFEAGSAYTINQIVLRVDQPTSGGTALLDVYRAANGQACSAANKANLTPLHTGDLNGAGTVGNQVAPLASSGLTMAIGDSVCLLTQQPYPANGSATLTVTAHSATE